MACGKDAFLGDPKVGTTSDIEVNIWKRSATADSGSTSVTAEQDLEKIVPKSPIILKDISSSAISPLSHAKFSVIYSLEDDEKPEYKKWIKREVPWLEKDFQAFMTYSAAQASLGLMEEILTPSKLYSAKNLSGKSIFPVKLESRACCDVFNTGYDPINRVVSFYEQGEAPLKNFHMSDEADVVMHEMGHVLQHATNPDPVEMPYDQNTDLDALQEGLADFFASVNFNNRSILSYMEGNIGELLKNGSARTGVEYKRNLNHSLSFPAGYRQDAHLDGRLVAGALADVAEIIEKETSQKSDSYQQTLKLANEVFALMATNSTLHKYSKLVVAESSKILGPTVCKNNPACVERVSTSVKQALLKRGILSPYDTVSNLPSAGIDYVVSTNLAFKEFPNFSMFSNQNGKIDPCEVILVYPKMTNLSPQNGKFYSFMDGLMMIDSHSNFSEVSHPNDSSDILDELDAKSENVKYLPWLNPGEDSATLINNFSSRLYLTEHGTSYTNPLSVTYYPSDLGWLVRAPSSGSGTVKFVIQFRTYNSDIIEYRNVTVQSSLSVNGTQSFCK